MNFKTFMTFNMLKALHKYFLSFLFCCFSYLLFASDINKLPANAQYGFIENKGQIIDQFHHQNKEVLFLFKTGNLQVQLKQTGFSYEVHKLITKSLTTGQEITPSVLSNDSFQSDLFVHRIDISFLNANKEVNISAFEPYTDFINYYTTATPEEGVVNVKHFKKVLYKNIYPNIDVEFMVSLKDNSNAGIKYNIIVHPGGNLQDVQLMIDGAKHTSLTPTGNILIETEYGNIEETIPYTYQFTQPNNKATRTASFKQISSNLFSIDVKQYNPKQTLVIDPAPWSSYYGGMYADFGYGITSDDSSNVMITGITQSINNIATTGAFQTTFLSFGNFFDAFIAKFNSSGVRLWATYYGQAYNDKGSDITCDTFGNIVITGITNSPSGMATTGAHRTTNAGGYDAFIAKFNRLGHRLWATFYGGSLDENFGQFTGTYETGGSITIDKSCNIIIVGTTLSTNNISTNSSFQTNKNGGYDAFIAKFDSSGTIIWATYYGGNGNDNYPVIGNKCGGKVITDDFENIYITGNTTSLTNIASNNGYDTTFEGEYDAYVAKFNKQGQRIWGSYYGGNGRDEGTGIVIDKSNNFYISGLTSSNNSISSNGSFQNSLSGNTDAFLVKFDSLGNRIWATYFGGIATDRSYGISATTTNEIVMTGYTSSIGLSTIGAVQTTYNGGGADVFIVKFDSLGNRKWSTYLGGTCDDGGNDISVEKSGKILITGWTCSSNNIAITGSYQQTYGFGLDAFVVVVSPNGELIELKNNLISGNQTICARTSPNNITGTIPLGALVGNLTYRWLVSTTDSIQQFTVAPGVNNLQNYNSPNLTQTSWFRRVVITGNKMDTSNAIQVNVLSRPHAGFTINNPGQCLAGNSFVFTDTSVFSGTYQRLWHFGESIHDTSALPLATKVYNSTGIFEVKLLLTNTQGCDDSITFNVSTGNNPVAVFTVNDTLQCQYNNSFTFSNFSFVTSGPLQYLWNFSSLTNDTSTLIQPNKNYQQSGIYQVRLIVNSLGCRDTAVANLQVLPMPKAGFAINNPGQCLIGNNFIFTDTSIFVGAYQRLWRFGSGVNDTSTLPVITRIYNDTGTYQMKLYLTNFRGCNDTITHTVSTGNKPTASFSINNTQQCQFSNLFVFNNQSVVSSGPLTFKWHFSNQQNDTSIQVNPQKTYMHSGNFQVRLIANSLGCTDTAYNQVSILPKPTAGFSQNSLTQCFKNNRFEFADTSIANGAGLLTRHWRFSSKPNDTSILQNPIKQYDTIGVYQVRLIVIPSNGCSDTVVKTVQTLVTPTPSVWTNTNTTQLLTGNFFRFAIAGSGYQSYSWDLGDTLHGQTWHGEVTRSYTSPAAYTVKLFTSNNNGCSDTAFLNIKILPNAPTQQASSLLFSNTTNASTRINWSNGNGTQRMVIARPGAAVNINPQNGMGYIANSVYGQGANLGGGNFVVYRGTNNFVNITGLNPLTQYHFAVFEFNGDSILSSYRLPGLHGNQATLPVTWLNFTAKLSESNSVKLYWQTATEINNKGFYVERSFNATDFKQIGFVKGNGNTSTISNYNFTDQLQTKNFEHRTSNFEPNIVYYRLKQIDFDGVYDYSKTISVNTQQANDALTWLSVFPNPASNEITIESNNDAIENITFYNTQGIICKQIHADNKLVPIQIEDLKTGLYQVWVQTKMANKCIKVVVK